MSLSTPYLVHLIILGETLCPDPLLTSLSEAYVPVPSMLPRPLLTSTFGIQYRKIPILAIGRDIYCDTSLIIEALEHFFPTSEGYGSVYPEFKGVEEWAYKGLVRGFASFWTDVSIFLPFYHTTKNHDSKKHSPLIQRTLTLMKPRNPSSAQQQASSHPPYGHLDSAQTAPNSSATNLIPLNSAQKYLQISRNWTYTCPCSSPHFLRQNRRGQYQRPRPR